jgi:hypothetical protein
MSSVVVVVVVVTVDGGKGGNPRKPETVSVLLR